MKKLVVIIMAISLVLLLCACQRLEQLSGALDDALEIGKQPAGSGVVAGISGAVVDPIGEAPTLTYDALTTADNWEINEILSHFVDTGLLSFDRNDPYATDLFLFAQLNNYYHSRHKIQTSGDGQHYYLTADDVSATLSEHFDIAVEHPLFVSEPVFFENNAYYWPCADGDMAVTFASISSLEYKAEQGLYEVSFDVFSPYDLFTFEIEGYYSFFYNEIAGSSDFMKTASGNALISYENSRCVIYSIEVNPL